MIRDKVVFEVRDDRIKYRLLREVAELQKPASNRSRRWG